MQVASAIVAGKDGPLFSHFFGAFKDSGMSFAAFIEKRFIPDHVEQKSLAGRTHYQSILNTAGMSISRSAAFSGNA